ncbi:MAG: endonuclease domain-containing protein [Chthoniobacterales bacterium]|nr:endonuclease domain-containing protein [Chthoniobacterales bacterium]
MPRPVAQARHLRKRSTAAERLLWSKLRNRKLYGYKFRRQHPLGGRFLDFFCLEASLAIELDGSGHGYEARQIADAERTAELLENGVRIIRFWNSEVLTNTSWVIEAILLELDPDNSRWGAPARPSPQSSPQGRGGRVRCERPE